MDVFLGGLKSGGSVPAMLTTEKNRAIRARKG
jgi:hypothetical protein